MITPKYWYAHLAINVFAFDIEDGGRPDGIFDQADSDFPETRLFICHNCIAAIDAIQLVENVVRPTFRHRFSCWINEG